MKTLVIIEWDEPKDQNWLNKYNIEIALHAYCPNTKFKVTDVTINDIIDERWRRDIINALISSPLSPDSAQPQAAPVQP